MSALGSQAVRTLISVVDDDESVRESLPELLRSHGLEARQFASASEFLESDAVNRTGCLILDVAMPVMSGPQLHAELARLKLAIPVVFITANLDERLRSTLLRSGAIACLIKPFNEAALLDAVRTALAQV